MNCIAWNVGHLAWQEQRYLLTRASGTTPFPDIAERFAVGAPGSTPELKEVLSAWRSITREADPWLDGLTSARLLEHPSSNGRRFRTAWGYPCQHFPEAFCSSHRSPAPSRCSSG